MTLIHVQLTETEARVVAKFLRLMEVAEIILIRRRRSLVGFRVDEEAHARRVAKKVRSQLEAQGF